MRARNVFFSLGVLSLLGGGYFFLQLTTGSTNVGEVIVLPIYIGFAVIIAAVCFVVGAILHLWGK